MRAAQAVLWGIIAAGLAGLGAPSRSQQLGVGSYGKLHPYVVALSKQIAARTIYPTVPARAGQQGSVVAGVTLRRDGNLVSARILRSSGSSVIDDALLSGIRSAAPFPPLPAVFEGDPAEIAVSIQFMLRKR
jgi:protein TonB